ncbi:carboxymuconolactone decarboxylase family protein [Nocardiopsis sp. EMB25]|uniref:carboxymuconolactone decarboxylase family protein n=1 Tax=Nocardiopsis sp. EMB25 TaxID=2835867 RepID=UPI002284F34A|nr:carboxymuconolactone decarboxylase family protein [Nocardiopsis sp. EMB25]MCY9785988.1 carboxymuconolactone decarboxylase family protein [Nocardiopsis sp. EMB25]
MDARLDILAVPSAGRALKDLPLPTRTRELVELRVSQINGCAVCVDMHTKEAAAAGETALRLNLVTAWREATVFTEAERAALEFAEQGTRVADAGTGVGDEVWANAAGHYDEEQLAALTLLVSFMNAVNRMNIITQRPAGDYVAGQFH